MSVKCLLKFKTTLHDAMYIYLICIGQKMPAWVNTGFQEYQKRIPACCTLELIEIPLQKRTKNADLTRIQQEEGKQILAAIPTGSHVIALDERGKMWDSLSLSQQLARWMLDFSTVSLLIGGPEGLAPACLQRAQQHWSLSPLTLPHAIVRVVVAEQLYRAWSILHHHPYHRA